MISSQVSRLELLLLFLPEIMSSLGVVVELLCWWDLYVCFDEVQIWGSWLLETGVLWIAMFEDDGKCWW